MTNEIKLYRGFADNISGQILENIFLKKPRTPKNTSPDFHLAADKWFLEQFGIRARSQTIFCSSDKEQAKKFVGSNGFLATISPLGEYKIIFSETVIDFIQFSIDSDLSLLEWLEIQNYQVANNINEIPANFKGEVMLYCKRFKVDMIV